MLGGEGAEFVPDALTPSGSTVQTLLQYVWSLWEDPIDVSNLEEGHFAMLIDI